MNCDNCLEIYGDYNDLINFFDENRIKKNIKRKLRNENILTFSKLLPVSNGQEKEKWGTSTDAVIEEYEDEIFEEETEQIYYKFYTLGNPPNIWLKEAARKYPSLEFNLLYQNHEHNIKGEIVYREGELYFSDRKELCDEVWNYIGDDVITDLTETLEKFYKKNGKKHFLNNLKDETSQEFLVIKNFLENYDENGLIIITKVINKIYENFSKVLEE